MTESILQNVKRSGFVLVAIFMLLQTTLPMTAFADGNGSPDECKDSSLNVLGSKTGTDDLVTVDTGAGKLATGVCIKSGDNMFGENKHSDVLTNGTYENGCYEVAGVGTQIVTVERIGVASDSCQGISHIDVTYEETTPDATVEVVKKLLPGNDTGLFNLKINNTTYATNVGDNGTTGEQTVDPEEDVVVTETPGTNTLLTDYTTNISCTNQNQEVIASGERTGAGSRTLTIDHEDIEVGDDITCTFNNTRIGDQIDYCDPSQRSNGQSIAEWLRYNQVDGSDCFEYTVSQKCGSFDVQFTKNLTPYTYSFRYSLGSDTPAPADWVGDGALPVAFNEDENDGSVTLTYYVIGPEKDYFSGFGMPNIWDGNGITVAVDTDCKEPTEPKPGSITIVKELDNEEDKDEQDFRFSPSWGDDFYLDVDDDATLPNQKTFSELPAGKYSVTEIVPEGWDLEDIDCDASSNYWEDDDETVEINLKAGAHITCTFTNDKDGGGNASIVYGNKYNDANNNSKWDENESGIENWTIEIYGYVCEQQPELISALIFDEINDDIYCNYQLFDTAQTDQNGYYTFLVGNGSYKICEVQQASWIQTFPAENGCHYVNLLSDITGSYDFGNTYQAQYGAIGGFKLNDTNGNTQKDEGEELLPDWKIQLYGQCENDERAATFLSLQTDDECWELVNETTTDINGYYKFNEVPAGTYKVCEVMQDGWTRTFPTDSNCHIVQVEEGKDYEINFANMQNDSNGEVLGTSTLVNTGTPVILSLVFGIAILSLLSTLLLTNNRQKN